jgi:hypothetical protein
MSAPFAALEARVNADVIRHLANATATIGAAPVDGIFDNDYISTFGMDGTSPAFQCTSASVAAVVRGTAITINCVNYKAVRKESDGTGWTTVILELAE